MEIDMQINEIENLSEKDLAEIGKQKLMKEIEIKKRWKVYNLRMAWAGDQYKTFAVENGFNLPTPTDEDLKEFDAKRVKRG